MTKKSIEVVLLNAFVFEGAGGNPAGLVLDADELKNDQKQEIARQVGLSETAFVSASTKAAFKLDFYTPTKQIADCGHATVATFAHLKQLGRLSKGTSSKEILTGIRTISIQEDLIFMEQQKPDYKILKNLETQILESLNLNDTDILPQAPILLVSTGMPMVLIPLANEASMQNVKPTFEKIKKITDSLEAVGYYVFATTSEDPSRDATARLFAPSYGIEEEAATGMAAGPLACYLHDKLAIQKTEYHIEQGKFMSPASISKLQVQLDIEKDVIKAVKVGGQAAYIKIINLDI